MFRIELRSVCQRQHIFGVIAEYPDNLVGLGQTRNVEPGLVQQVFYHRLVRAEHNQVPGKPRIHSVEPMLTMTVCCKFFDLEYFFLRLCHVGCAALLI